MTAKRNILASGMKTVPTGVAETIVPASVVNKNASCLWVKSDDGAAINGNTAVIFHSEDAAMAAANKPGSRPGETHSWDAGPSSPSEPMLLEFKTIYCISGTAGQILMWELLG